MNRSWALFIGVAFSVNTMAITPAQDIAATINLNGYACGNQASDITESVDDNGNKTITASCADGKRYQVIITSKGRISVNAL